MMYISILSEIVLSLSLSLSREGFFVRRIYQQKHTYLVLPI